MFTPVEPDGASFASGPGFVSAPFGPLWTGYFHSSGRSAYPPPALGHGQRSPAAQALAKEGEAVLHTGKGNASREHSEGSARKRHEWMVRYKDLERPSFPGGNIRASLKLGLHGQPFADPAGSPGRKWPDLITAPDPLLPELTPPLPAPPTPCGAPPDAAGRTCHRRTR